MGKMGRPPKPIDKQEFEKLCGLQCTLDEICGWFDICPDTLEKWCKATYGRGMTFSKVFAQKRSRGKISLRRNQFKLAEKNANMAIWLGKQYLGQTDTPKDETPPDNGDGFLEALNGTAPEDWNDAGDIPV